MSPNSVDIVANPVWPRLGVRNGRKPNVAKYLAATAFRQRVHWGAASVGRR
jgi:hypothetical protein